MTVITVRGQMGSGAPEIGKIIANKLRIDYVDQKIIADVAARLDWSERGIAEKEMPPGTIIGRIVEALTHNSTGDPGYSGIYQPTWEIPLVTGDYLAGLKSVIKDLASNQSIVIRGRGSQFILKDFPGAFHVLFVAPLAIRLKRVMRDLNTTKEGAKIEITRFDSSRREFTKRYFHANLEDPLHYDLVINTKLLSFESAASIVVQASKKHHMK